MFERIIQNKDGKYFILRGILEKEHLIYQSYSDGSGLYQWIWSKSIVYPPKLYDTIDEAEKAYEETIQQHKEYKESLKKRKEDRKNLNFRFVKYLK
jgi:hypothetical protein